MKLTVTTFLTLDGVMQGPGAPDEDRSGGFTLGGWLVPYADDDMGRIVDEQFATADAFLLGRRTYEIFAGFWPHQTDPADPVASKLNSLPKHVVSTTLTESGWEGTTFIGADGGNVLEQVAELKRGEGRDLQVHGSGTLARSLLDAGLVDEWRLWRYPVVLGAGNRLFAKGLTPTAMTHADTQITAAGVVMSTYRTAGAPVTGTFDDEQP